MKRRGHERRLRGAHSVASTETSTVWVADLAGGGRCLELTTALYPDVRAPGCTTGEQLGGMPITATLPNPDHAAASDPVVIAGSVEPAAASLSLVLADGPTIAVPFGAPHFYVTDFTGSDAAEVRADGVTVVARDTSGHELARLTVPADWEASAADEASQATIDITSGVTDGLYDLQVITTDKSGNTLTSALISNVRARTRRLMT